MKRYLLTLGLACLLALGACDTMKSLVPTLSAKTPAQHMLALEVEYNGVYALMKQYEDIQRCSPTGSKICSEQNVVNKMRAVNTAFDTQSLSAWKIIKDISASPTAKDAAIATVANLVGEATTLYSSVSTVIAAFKETK